MISRTIPHDELQATVLRFGRRSREARQVWERLRDLLPRRLRELHKSHPARAQTSSSSQTMRLALTDPRYLEHIDELVEIGHQAREARIQYETHLMLFEARRSLRPFLKGSRDR